MRAIAGPGHVSNEFVDYDATTNPNGTVITADWANDVQDELLGIQTEAAVSESAGTNTYVLSSIKRLIKEHAMPITSLFYIDGDAQDVAAFDPNDPDSYFPYKCLSNIDDSEVVDVANYPDLITPLRNKRTEYKVNGSAAVSSWTVTVSGSNITFGGADSDTAVLTAIVEEAYYVDAQQSSPSGSPDYTNLAKTINVAGTDYVITGINLGTSVVTVTGSPSTGSQTAIFYPHRIAGSTTTARLFQATGMGLMSPGDPDGLFVTGVRRRGYFQGHELKIFGDADGTIEFNQRINLSTATGGALDVMVTGGGASADNRARVFDTDGTNGTPRTGPETHGPALVAHLYMATGRYIA